MILYLSSNQNIGIFDAMAKVQGEVVKKLSGEFSFKSFVIRDMRNLSHYETFAIDMKAMKDTEDEFIEAINAFKAMYESRIIIFAEGLKSDSTLLDRLISCEVYNIITGTTIELINQEIKQTLSPEGMSYQDAMKYKGVVPGTSEVKQVHSFICENIQVAVVGAERKVGTTTVAMNIANYLASLGAKVYYVELDNSDHLVSIGEYYKEMVKRDYGYERKGVKYIKPSSSFDWNANFIIFDVGKLEKDKSRVIGNCKINILCSGSKPYELADLMTAQEIYGDTKVNLLINHAEEYSRQKLKKALSNKTADVYFPEYSPDFFNGKANEEIFKVMFNDYVIEHR